MVSSVSCDSTSARVSIVRKRAFNIVNLQLVKFLAQLSRNTCAAALLSGPGQQGESAGEGSPVGLNWRGLAAAAAAGALTCGG